MFVPVSGFSLFALLRYCLPIMPAHSAVGERAAAVRVVVVEACVREQMASALPRAELSLRRRARNSSRAMP